MPHVDLSHLCPPESSIASPASFREVVRIRDGETAFQTVKRFRLAERKKNQDLRRMYLAYEACRKSTLEQNKTAKEDRKDAVESLSGG